MNHILLIDDDPAILDAMSRELADRGCIPIARGNAVEAASKRAGELGEQIVARFNQAADKH